MCQEILPDDLTDKRLLIIATGGSGTGKTRVAGVGIDSAAQQFGLPPVDYINEYDLVKEWFKLHANDEEHMQIVHTEGDGPEGHKELTHDGYKQLYTYADSGIIRKFKENPSAQIVRTEAARNLEFDYSHLFMALVREFGHNTYFANVHMTVNNTKILKPRAIHRLNDEPDAAPWAIVELYDKVKHDFESPVATAQRFPEFILNGTITNDKNIDAAREKVRALFANAFAAYARQS